MIHDAEDNTRTFASYEEAQAAFAAGLIKGAILVGKMKKYNLTPYEERLFWVPVYPPMEKADLKTILQGLLSGQMLAHTQVPNNLLSMVFLPVAFGCLAMPEEVLLCLTGPEPEETVPPKKPVIAPYGVSAPTKPQGYTLVEIPQDLQLKKEYGYLSPEDYEAETADVVAKNKELTEGYQKAQEQYLLDLAAWEEESKVHDLKEQQKLAAWEKLCEEIRLQSLDGRIAAWKKRKEEIQEICHQIQVASLGAVVGNMADTFARSINGYPIFHAVRIVNAEDWARIVVAYEKEVKRMADMDL